MGPGVAIHSYKILMSDPDAAVAATATLCALRCAVLTRNEHEMGQLITLWGECAAGRPGEAVEQLIARLLAEGRQRQARALCEAEANRRPTARSVYLAARVSEQLGEHDAARAHYRTAAELATDDKEQPIAAAAQPE